jgi:hypothetical protein
MYSLKLKQNGTGNVFTLPVLFFIVDFA